jgi:hypothetical protein
MLELVLMLIERSAITASEFSPELIEHPFARLHLPGRKDSHQIGFVGKSNSARPNPLTFVTIMTFLHPRLGSAFN